MSPPSNPHDDTMREETDSVAADPLRTYEVGIYPGLVLKDRYLIEKELGRGGIGAVYKAVDQQLLSKPVVVKVLLDAAEKNNWLVNKFKHEMEALARIDHPCVVGVLDTGQTSDGKPYLVMQYVDGVTLRSELISEGMELERAANIIKQVGHALSAAHDKGIIHRDLKPENIMLQTLRERIEQVKIIDFGIAKVKDSQMAQSTVAKGTAGTIAYMAPEQLHAKAVSSTTDIYALGAIAYEMLTGRRPFNSRTMAQLSELQRAGIKLKPSDLRPDLPPAAEGVILKALAYHPEERYQSASAFGEALAQALTSGEGSELHLSLSQAETIPLAEETAQQKKSDKKLNPIWITLPALLALGIIGLIIWTRGRSKVDAPPQPTQVVAPAPSATHTFSYSLMVQKTRDGRPEGEVFESSVQEYFKSGWKFRINISSPQAGFLYLLNEGPMEQGGVSYNLLFPQTADAGSAHLPANQMVQTPWYVVDEHPGTERFWMVWATQPVTQLEIPTGIITNPAQIYGVREFLSKHASTQAQAQEDEVHRFTTVTGEGDVLLNLMELKHR